MSNRIKDAFEQIHATEQMKDTAYSCLQKRIDGRANGLYSVCVRSPPSAFSCFSLPVQEAGISGQSRYPI